MQHKKSKETKQSNVTMQHLVDATHENAALFATNAL